MKKVWLILLLSSVCMAADSFESVAVIPDTDGVENEVWVIVNREIDDADYEPNYPTLRIADGTFSARQADPGLTQTTAIADVNDLQAMNNDLTGNYYLTGDIDASATSGWNGGAGFIPIGEYGDGFTGTFDGCGYTISDLYINDATLGTERGLFGSVEDGTIANVTLADVNITGCSNVGALIGMTNSNSNNIYIYNCHVSGSVKGGVDSGYRLEEFVGGLIGLVAAGNTVYHYFYDCTSSCTVDTTGSGTNNSYTECGGFVGSSLHGKFYNCRATGSVTGKTDRDTIFGGFIGDSSTTTVIQDCSATGDVTGCEYIGGFCGLAVQCTFTRCSARGDITAAESTVGGFCGNSYGTNCTWTDCYSWGDANGVDEKDVSGGFIGSVNANTTFTNCYSIGVPTGADNPTYGDLVGGFIGRDFGGSSTYTADFWDTTTSGESEDGTGGGAVGHVTSWMQTQDNFEDAGWDFTTVWYMPSETESVRYVEQVQPIAWYADEDINDAWFVDCSPQGRQIWHPAVAGQDAQVADYPILFGTDDQADPGLTHTTAISNVTELENMKNDLAGNYYLTGDIDASATVGWDSGRGFNPVGGSYSVAPFTGTFDGCGYTITGLYINRSTSDNGLFATMTDGAKIANVTLADVDIYGSNNTGALVGQAMALASDVLIQNCHSSGTVESDGYNTGGLVGHFYTDAATPYMYDCSSSCTVLSDGTFNYHIGGLIGLMADGVVSNCYATGDVGQANTRYNAGGLIGTMAETGNSSLVTYCYATGDVTAKKIVGGFVGAITHDKVIQKCYATGNVTAGGATSAYGQAGGFVGDGSGAQVTDCYAWGDVTCTDNNGQVGGFCGYSTYGGAVYTNCYSIGVPTGLLNPGGFIEDGLPDATYTACFWDTEVSGESDSDGGVGHITTWMKTKTNYEDAGWNMTTIWDMNEAIPAVDPVAAYYETLDVNYAHLEGRDVCVFADGNSIGTYTVSDANLTGFTDTYDYVLGGLNYYSIYETYPIVLKSQYDTTATKTSRIYHCLMGVEDSMEAEVGVISSDLSDLYFSGLETEIKEFLFPHGSTREPTFYLSVWEPEPFTMNALVLDMEVQDD